MTTRQQTASQRGATLIELMVVLAVMAVVMAGITRVVLDLMRTQAVRTVNVKVQEEGRDGLSRVQSELRQASLGSPVGVLWLQDAAGAVVRRPAVQIYDNVTGGGRLDMKPGTDALLVVGATPSGAEAVLVGDHYDATAGLTLTSTADFEAGMFVMVGPYQAAGWGEVRGKAATTISLAVTANVFPDLGGRAASGSMVRQARSRLYFVTVNDELVEQELRVPRPPASDAEGGPRHVIGRGVENLQVECDGDDGAAVLPCPAVLDAADPMAAEAEWAMGAWDAGGPRLNPVTVALLRTVMLSVVVRSQQPLRVPRGDPAVALENQAALPVGGGDATQPYLRRAYRLPVAVRNVALGAL